jgi:predicted dehydrogenase/threonine dehydrogenase-like Zn-dependent dehydrogenase
MLVDFGNANWLEKARQQPDKVRMVLEKARTDGMVATYEAVMRKLDQPIPMGYCNVGRVAEIGDSAGGFAIGDRVVSNGKHAEFVSVPSNLCARIPDAVSDEAAAFAVLGSIALQGIRLANPTLGECVVVTGLGLIGLLAVQLLKAHGCRVLGIDFDGERLALARSYGAEVVDLASGADPIKEAARFSRGRGIDAVLITASTASSEPVHQAAVMCRKRGRIILVGVTGLDLSRADFYEKELSFQVSCSYGPGRYDAEYEEKGHDYPLAYVRWTEQRNFEAVLDMLAERRLDVSQLASHRFPIAQAASAYELISSSTPSLGVLLTYPPNHSSAAEGSRRVQVAPISKTAKPVIAFIGAGNYATSVLIPAFRGKGARLKTIASANGVSGTYAARKFGIEISTTETDAILSDPEVSAVVIATRHSSHAKWVCDALGAGKHVFVEKPLAMSMFEFEAVERAYQDRQARGAAPIVAVGFNRRFAPHIGKAKSLLSGIAAPKSILITVNAGAIPPDHWTQDPAVGGGRIVGEVCHFLDLMRYLVGESIASVSTTALKDPGSALAVPDTCTVSVTFADGSMGTVHYLSNGHRAVPKERIEIFADGRVIRIDNYRSMTVYGWPKVGPLRLWRQDKGQSQCAAAFLESLQTGITPIPFAELLEVGRATVQASDSARVG